MAGLRTGMATNRISGGVAARRCKRGICAFFDSRRPIFSPSASANLVKNEGQVLHPCFLSFFSIWICVIARPDPDAHLTPMLIDK
jgi:hypothetical protein